MERKIDIRTWAKEPKFPVAVDTSWVDKFSRKKSSKKLAVFKKDYNRFESINLADRTGLVTASSDPLLINKVKVGWGTKIFRFNISKTRAWTAVKGRKTALVSAQFDGCNRLTTFKQVKEPRIYISVAADYHDIFSPVTALTQVKCRHSREYQYSGCCR